MFNRDSDSTFGFMAAPVPESSSLATPTLKGLGALRLIRRKRVVAALAVIACCGTMASHASAAVTNYRLFKEAYYGQTGPNTVALNFWAMDANIQASPDYATDIVLTPPAPGAPLSDSVVDGFWEVFFDYPDQPALEAAYPDGTYDYAISGGAGGNQTASLTMPDDFFPADVPQFSAATFNGIGVADPAHDFLLGWNSFSPDSRALNARVRFGLHDLTDESFPIFAGNLPASTTEFLIPGGTLIPGHDYELLLIFSNAIRETNAGFGSATSLVDANRSVTFEFTAVPEPSSLALLAAAGVCGVLVRTRRRFR